MDTSLGTLVLFEQVERDAVEHGEVMGGMSGAFAIQILAEAHVERPVQLVFEAPVPSIGAIQPRRIRAEARDVVADFLFGFACGLVESFALDSH